jgi:hypothetical protein
MVKLKEFFLLGPAEAAGEDERLLKDLLASSSDKEGERRFFWWPGLTSPTSVAHSLCCIFSFSILMLVLWKPSFLTGPFFVNLDLIYGFPDSKLRGLLMQFRSLNSRLPVLFICEGMVDVRFWDSGRIRNSKLSPRACGLFLPFCMVDW